MVMPAGNPAWTRSAGHADYGGHVNKRNYQSLGVVNPRTDIGAEAWTRLAADMEALVRTASFFECTYLNHDASPDDPTIESVYLMTGVRTSSYEGDNPPTGFPGATRSSDGVVVFTFASSYTDPYGVSASFTPRMAIATCHGTEFADATATISGQTVTVRVFDAAGVAMLDVRVSLIVW